MPFNGAGRFSGIELTRDLLALMTKVKKGEGTLRFLSDRKGKDLCEMELAADGSAPVALGVSAYGGNEVGEVDPSFVAVGATISPEQSAKLFDGIMKAIKEKYYPDYLCFEFSEGRLSRAHAERSNDAGWGSQRRDTSAFSIRFGDLLSIGRAITRLVGKSIPVFKADPRGLLVVELTTDFGTYSIAVPAVYPGTDTRRSGFSRPFSPAPEPKAAAAALDEPSDDGEEEASGDAPDGDDEQS